MISPSGRCSWRNSALFFDFSGPGNPENPNQRMLLVMSMINDDVWFFKMTGTQQVVESEKGKFDEFLKSVEFEK
jgi:capsid portal protein